MKTPLLRTFLLGHFMLVFDCFYLIRNKVKKAILFNRVNLWARLNVANYIDTQCTQ